MNVRALIAAVAVAAVAIPPALVQLAEDPSILGVEAVIQHVNVLTS
ncbi:hypothetical protein [Nonomuraea sp. LPB2021202275-12-8]